MDKILRLLSDKSFKKYLLRKKMDEDRTITTKIKQHIKIGHDFGVGLTEEESDELFELLKREGLIKGELYTNIVCCPYCDSTDVVTSYLCPRCNSLDISKQYIIQHLSCGSSFPSETLHISKCLKCGATIKSSDELRVTGGLFKCNNCGFSFGTPKIKYLCNSCNRTFDLREAQVKKINLYSFKEDGKKIMDILFIYKRIAEEFMNMGFDVKMPAEVQGSSGVVHTFALAIRDKNNNHYVIDLTGYLDDLTMEDIIKNYIKIIDINAGRYIYVVRSKNASIEAFINSLPAKNIILLDAENVDEILRKLKEIIS